MNKTEINNFLLAHLKGRLSRIGIEEREITPDYDLVKTGLLDSISFVDLLVEAEGQYNIQIDFEAAFQDPVFTTLSGLVDIIYAQINE